MVTEAQIENKVDLLLTTFQTTPIQYYPYVTGVADIYKQHALSFGTPITVVGRAIPEPTEEQLTDVGRLVDIDVAFLFSRLEMVRKFPLAPDGHWMEDSGQLSWNNARYRIVKLVPSGQVKTKFLLYIALAKDL